MHSCADSCSFHLQVAAEIKIPGDFFHFSLNGPVSVNLCSAQPQRPVFGTEPDVVFCSRLNVLCLLRCFSAQRGCKKLPWRFCQLKADVHSLRPLTSTRCFLPQNYSSLDVFHFSHHCCRLLSDQQFLKTLKLACLAPTITPWSKLLRSHFPLF